MNKKTALTIALGVLLAALIISLVVAMFLISNKRKEVDSLSNDLKNRDAKLSQLEKQVESLNAEKSSLAGMKLSLEGRINSLESDIGSAKEKEASLNKKIAAFAEEKKKLENELTQTTQLMKDKLRLSEQKNMKELARKSKQYLAQKEEFTSRLDDLTQKIKNLSEEKDALEKNAVSAAEVTARLLKEKEKLDHYKLGLSDENNRDFEAAAREYEDILKIDPQDANIYLRLASIYLYNIRDPERADYYAKAYAALSKKELPDGKQVSESSLASAVDEKIALTRKLNEAEQKLSRKYKEKHIPGGDFSEYFGTYKEKALKRHYNLALVYENAGRYKEAAEEYEKTLELAPDDADIHYNLAIVYDDHLQDNEKAIIHYRRYLELAPDAKDASMVAAWMYEARDDLEWQRRTR
ncbi:MAG: tetratricopeptide repeat protein [Candidatus Omnitrophica bacterium]|nr:tetratricopeptide repeat protein [Candidatus Omnitrophota bacterium]